jgi:hypothetical protein
VSNKFSHQAFNALIAQTIEQINKLSTLKGGEYAGDDDRLANFRRNGENLGLPMETVWAVYAAKHWDAVMQYVQDLNTGKTRDRLEPLEGRLDDIIVYCILFKAILAERHQNHRLAIEALKNAPGVAVAHGPISQQFPNPLMFGC